MITQIPRLTVQRQLIPGGGGSSVIVGIPTIHRGIGYGPLATITRGYTYV
jgi:hypothetical protein